VKEIMNGKKRKYKYSNSKNILIKGKQENKCRMERNEKKIFS
jgi:hypothetical protein